MKLEGEPPLWRPLSIYRWAQPCTLWELVSTWYLPRWTWRLVSWLRNPRGEFAYLRRYHQRPKVGGYLMYHDEGPYKVLARDGDDFTVESPHGPMSVSWMNCCDPVKGRKETR